MKPITAIAVASILVVSACITAQDSFSYKDVTVKWLGHSGFEITGAKKIYIDPYKTGTNGTADLILITHGHPDHCDAASVKQLQKKETQIFSTTDCINNLTGLINLLRPGESVTYPDGVKIEAVQAYNIDKPYHQKGEGIGFLITMDNVTIYHAGDTDFVPEMPRGVDIALLPIGGTYTMGVDEAAEAAKTINPKVVVPMHYNSAALGINGVDADADRFQDLLKGTGIEVKILDY